MAKNSDIAVLDIGSQKLTAIIADGNDEMLSIRKDAISEVSYAGFVDGKWVQPENLRNTIRSLLKLAMVRNKVNPQTIYVGVPGEFTTAYCQEERIYFPSNKKVTATDIEMLFDSDEKVNHHKRYKVINKSPIYYTLSDGKETLSPIDSMSDSLSGMLSYILCERSFIKDMTNILTEIGFENVKFVSSCLAESLHLFETSTRDRSLVLIDAGYLTTSVIIIKADGVMYMKSFSLGGAFISVDLSTEFNVNYEVAEKLRDMLRLSLNVTKENTYEFILNNEKYSFNAVKVHEIAENRIAEIAQMIHACIENCQYELPADIPMYLTGGGLSYIQGAQVLSAMLQSEIVVAAPTFQLFGKPHLSSVYGLLKYAGKEERAKKKGFFAALSKIFNK